MSAEEYMLWVELQGRFKRARSVNCRKSQTHFLQISLGAKSIDVTGTYQDTRHIPIKIKIEI